MGERYKKNYIKKYFFKCKNFEINIPRQKKEYAKILTL